MTAPQNLPYPAAKEFVASYSNRYGSPPPSVYTLTNADGMRAVMQAIEHTQSIVLHDSAPRLLASPEMQAAYLGKA